jgi:hypothetical protein
MTVEWLSNPSDADWLAARNQALITRRQWSAVIPNETLKLKFFCSEHSPITTLNYSWIWHDQMSWVATHIVRHWLGIKHFISSQRNDLQIEYDRNEAPQKSPVEHLCHANAQAILNISKARICLNASKETRQDWREFVEMLRTVEPQLAKLCVAPCVYRNGICPEVFNHCGYNHTPKFFREVEEYRNIFFSFEKPIYRLKASSS